MIVRSLNSFFLLLLFFQVTNARNNNPNTNNSRALKIRPGVYAFSLIHQDQVLFRRRRNMQEKEKNLDLLQAAELYQGYGTHYVDLWLGLPNPQRQTVIVDTGSQTTAFPCVECTDCGEKYHTDHYYNHTQSETFRKLGCNECQLGRCSSSSNNNNDECTMGLSYQEGSSWRAYEAVDKVYTGGLHDQSVSEEEESNTIMNTANTTTISVASAGESPLHASAFTFDLHFGCQHRITGLFKTQLADGIMGMGNDKSSFWNQMYTEQKMNAKQFSLCFARGENAERNGTTAGAMIMGGVERKLHETPLVYAKNTRSSGHYTVRVRSMYLRTNGGLEAWDNTDEVHKLNVNEIILNSGGVIVDSGTTDTYINRAVSAPFKQLFKEITGFEHSNKGMDLTDDMIEKLPTILVQLEGNEEMNQNAMKDLGEDKPEQVLGLAATIDPEHKFDVLVSIPPYHYIEYDESKKKYVSRVYLDERSGSVLGANTMQGHDVLFDIDNKVVGFAESSCEYSIITGEKLPDFNFTVEPTNIDKDTQEEEGESESNDAKESELKDTAFQNIEPSDMSSTENTKYYCKTITCRASVMGIALLMLILTQVFVFWNCINRIISSSSAQSMDTEGMMPVQTSDDEEILRDLDEVSTEIVSSGGGNRIV